MIVNKIKKLNNSGFVLLFAIVLSSMILAIAIGILNISFKEVSFTTGAKSANDAFYAADLGAECALYWDKRGAFGTVASLENPIVTTCAGTSFDISTPTLDPNGITTWNFILLGLSGSTRSCAKVEVTKNTTTNPSTTNIIAKGYNTTDNSLCTSTNINLVERLIEINYED